MHPYTFSALLCGTPLVCYVVAYGYLNGANLDTLLENVVNVFVYTTLFIGIHSPLLHHNRDWVELRVVFFVRLLMFAITAVTNCMTLTESAGPVVSDQWAVRLAVLSECQLSFTLLYVLGCRCWTPQGGTPTAAPVTRNVDPATRTAADSATQPLLRHRDCDDTPTHQPRFGGYDARSGGLGRATRSAGGGGGGGEVVPEDDPEHAHVQCGSGAQPRRQSGVADHSQSDEDSDDVAMGDSEGGRVAERVGDAAVEVRSPGHQVGALSRGSTVLDVLDDITGSFMGNAFLAMREHSRTVLGTAIRNS